MTAEDNTLDVLYTYTSTLYNLRIPLTLTEKRTPEIRFSAGVDPRSPGGASAVARLTSAA